MLDRAVGSEAWLRGPFGPPFFNVAFFMGLMYTGLGITLRKPYAGAGTFLALLLPMLVLTRFNLPGWPYVVTIVYVLAVWGTIYHLGGVAGMVGVMTGFLALTVMVYLVPALQTYFLNGYLAAPTVLLDGAFTGLGLTYRRKA